MDGKSNCFPNLAHYGGAIGLIILGFVSASKVGAVSILTIAVALNAGTMVGYQVSTKIGKISEKAIIIIEILQIWIF